MATSTGQPSRAGPTVSPMAAERSSKSPRVACCHAVQLLRPKRLYRWLYPLRRASSGYQRGPIRDNRRWRGQRKLWDDLQNHPGGRADHALQLLLPKRLHGRCVPQRGPRPGHQRGLLRDNHVRRGQYRLWHGLRPVCGSGPVCENRAHLRRSGNGRQDSGDQSDRREQRYL